MRHLVYHLHNARFIQAAVFLQDLLPKISDERGSDLHDLVEQEMASTTQAVEQAAERIEALLNEARQRDSGVNLEVNERYVASLTPPVAIVQVYSHHHTIVCLEF